MTVASGGNFTQATALQSTMSLAWRTCSTISGSLMPAMEALSLLYPADSYHHGIDSIIL
jgi:hypothetical protein